MKPGVLCLLLLSGCSSLSPSDDSDVVEYTLTWYCISPEGCERTAEVQRIDRATVDFWDVRFMSTQDESFAEDAKSVGSDTLAVRCSWLHFLSLFGYELEPSKFCFTPGGFEVHLSIPDEDPATHSKWVVSARDLSLQ
jgi:hypothetical protein